MVVWRIRGRRRCIGLRGARAPALLGSHPSLEVVLARRVERRHPGGPSLPALNAPTPASFLDRSTPGRCGGRRGVPGPIRTASPSASCRAPWTRRAVVDLGADFRPCRCLRPLYGSEHGGAEFSTRSSSGYRSCPRRHSRRRARRLPGCLPDRSGAGPGAPGGRGLVEPDGITVDAMSGIWEGPRTVGGDLSSEPTATHGLRVLDTSHGRDRVRALAHGAVRRSSRSSSPPPRPDGAGGSSPTCHPPRAVGCRRVRSSTATAGFYAAAPSCRSSTKRAHQGQAGSNAPTYGPPRRTDGSLGPALETWARARRARPSRTRTCSWAPEDAGARRLQDLDVSVTAAAGFGKRAGCGSRPTAGPPSRAWRPPIAHR